MKKYILATAIAVSAIACSPKKEGNMMVSGKIKGLKKGTIYLQKMKDTVLTSIDSVAIFGDNNFILSDNINSSEMYYLTLSNNTSEKRILFFGEKGNITINDNLDKFGLNPEILGSNNQEILNKYNNYLKRFQDQRLEFIKKDFEAKKAKDSNLVNKLEQDYNKMLKKKVLFATNYAIANSEKEVAAYIALTLSDASLKMIDTINNSLSDEVKKSKYGKQLQEYIDKIKK